jgi:hypothetical protein
MTKEPKKRSPLVVVSGSADEDRQYKMPMPNPAAAREAAVRIGAALAKAGCRIAVFSADPHYIECQVVHGFVDVLKSKAKKDRAERIEIRAPLGSNTAFAERQQYSDIFADRTDQHSGWRRSFVRTLSQADAVLLIGGERMTEAVGHAAVAFRIPVLALASYGGAAQQVWAAMVPDKDRPTQREYQAMSAPDWSNQRAEQVVDDLLAQIARREKEDNAAAEAARTLNRQLGARSSFGAVVLVVAILLTWAASWVPETGWANLLLYLLGPIGGCAAALTGSTLQERPPHGIVHAASLGFFAGFLASALYLLAQISAGPETFRPKPVAFWFACLTGIGAGFTAEKMLREWMTGKKTPVIPKASS